MLYRSILGEVRSLEHWVLQSTTITYSSIVEVLVMILVFYVNNFHNLLLDLLQHI